MSPTPSPVESPRVPLIEIDKVSRRYPGVLALDEVSISVYPGEVLAVIGENGAGKSTLMKIMAGVAEPTSGTLKIEGRVVQLSNPRQAIDAGIALIHQELNLADNLSIAENVYLGREPRKWGCLVDKQQMESMARSYLTRVGLDVEPSQPLASLSLASQQLVEIAKALSSRARVVIMDEPTSSLSTREAEKLFDCVETLRSEGVAIVYISHRLGEVIRLADRVEILRDGRNAGALQKDSITHDAMVTGMVGRQLDQLFARQPHSPGEVRLRVHELVADQPGKPAISFEIRSGEVVGLAGLVGSGRSEVLESLFGVRPRFSGQVTVDGKELEAHNVLTAIQAGMALVPEDRKVTGLVLEMSVGENLTLSALETSPLAPWIQSAWEEQVASESIEKLNIKTASADVAVATLSGGNQQKVALGKWLLRKPGVLLLDEPTRGVDIGAKHEIYTLIGQLAASGVAILFVSSEMEEILGLADRALVMHEGRITGELTRKELTEERIMRLAVGDSLPPIVDHAS